MGIKTLFRSRKTLFDFNRRFRITLDVRTHYVGPEDLEERIRAALGLLVEKIDIHEVGRTIHVFPNDAQPENQLPQHNKGRSQ